LVNPIFFQNVPTHVFDSKFKENSSIYILLASDDHWVTLTNINKVNPGKWVVYDSLNDKAYVKSLKSGIDKFERSIDQDIVGKIIVNSINMQQQTGIDDCGLFALACAIELAYNIDPAGI
jgi:hypothetical protein